MLRSLLLSLSLAAGLAGPELAAAGDAADASVQSDACSFFRSQAYGRGLSHAATEMLWACEAVDARRRAEIALSDRLVAVDLALERYRNAVSAAGRDAADGSRDGLYFGLTEARKAEIAERTGMAAALEAVRLGF